MSARNYNFRINIYSHMRTGMSGLGRLALTTWAGWSAVQVGRHVKCWSRSKDLHVNRGR